MGTKRILIVTEGFSLGGLETHLAGMVRVVVAAGHQCYLAVGGDPTGEDLPAGLADVLSGLPFNWPATAKDLLTGVERMTAFIREHKINAVHAHPYLSLLPAALAAQRAEVPLIMTLHGPGNVNPPGEGYGFLHQYVLRFFSLPTANLVYCVSPEVSALVQPILGRATVRVLPNAVDVHAYAPPPTMGNRWAAVGRLDTFKVQGLKDFCRKALACGMKPIDIYGDGPAGEEFKGFIADLGAADAIVLRGATRTLASDLQGGYLGVAGMGRVVLEAAAMNLPVVLVGYDGVKGLLDETTATQAAWWNFSGRGMDTVSAADLSRQVNGLLASETQRFQLREWVGRAHNEDTIWGQYLAEIAECRHRSNPLSGQIENIIKAYAGTTGPYLLEKDLLRDITTEFARSSAAAKQELELKLALDAETMRSVLVRSENQLSSTLDLARERTAALESVMARLSREEEQLNLRLSEKQEQINRLAERLSQESQAHGALALQCARQIEHIQQLSESERRRQTEKQQQTAEIAALRAEMAAATRQTEQMSAQLVERDSRIHALLSSHPCSQQDLDHLRESVHAAIGTLEEFKLHKGFRAARWLHLLRNEFLKTSPRGRSEFVQRLAKRVSGSKAPISSFNALDIPIHQLRQALSFVNGSPANVDPALPPMPALRPRPGVVNIMTYLFYDMQGKALMGGGAERYLIELCRLIKELGFAPEIYQCGHGSWVRNCDSVKVTGIDVAGDIRPFNRRAHEQVAPGALTIYSAFNLAQPYFHDNSLGISHGVFWDHVGFQNPLEMGAILRGIHNCRHIVSVDSNTINWTRATIKECADRFTYVPNFVDLDTFRPGPARDGQRLVVLYARRLYRPRGFWLIAELIPDLLKRYPNVDFHFVGKGEEQESNALRELQAKYGERVRWSFFEPDDMHKAYHGADISVVPTMASEGTSLSCLEALACGNAVIATDVGGLPELVIDGYNGLLVAPRADEIREAIERLINDIELRRRLQTNGQQVALSYNIETWCARWRRVLQKQLSQGVQGGSDSAREPGEAKLEYFHPSAGGVVWERMRQRPQQLFQALAEIGETAHFGCDDQRQEAVSIEGRLHLLGRDQSPRVRRPVVHIYYAYNYKKLRDLEDPIVIYDVLDDPIIHAASDRAAGISPTEDFLHYHNLLMREADLVITSSRRLQQRYRQERPDIELVPNGVRPEDFQRVTGPRPKDMPAQGPVIGYYGAVAEWFDFEMLEHAARQRPNYQFVLIGLTNRLPDIEKVTARHKNIRYLGEKRYTDLPAYLAAFDVGTIPFLLNEITHAVSPVKLFEYAAGGKPIVTTAMEEILQYAEVLTAAGAPDFVLKLDGALKLGQNAEFREKLRKLAEANSWRERARRIVTGIHALKR